MLGSASANYTILGSTLVVSGRAGSVKTTAFTGVWWFLAVAANWSNSSPLCQEDGVQIRLVRALNWYWAGCCHLFLHHQRLPTPCSISSNFLLLQDTTKWPSVNKPSDKGAIANDPVRSSANQSSNIQRLLYVFEGLMEGWHRRRDALPSPRQLLKRLARMGQVVFILYKMPDEKPYPTS